MDTIAETEKRLKIASSISEQIEGIVLGVLLGGSMAYGQNYSVNENSDIDMVIVCEKNRIREVSKTNYFLDQIDKETMQMFEDETINLVWVTKIKDSVEVNSFIYEMQGYEDFCLLKGKIKGYRLSGPGQTQTSYRFDGTPITFNRNVTPYKKGYLYEKPALADGIYWGGPPRDDFIFGSYILCQKSSYFDTLKKIVWDAIIKQLIKEHGSNLDLKQINLINTSYIYQTAPQRIPKELVIRVMKETEERLKAEKNE